MAAGLAEHERLNREIAAQSSSSANEVNHLQRRCASLAQQLAERESLLQEKSVKFEEAFKQQSAEKQKLQTQLHAAEASSMAIVSGNKGHKQCQWPTSGIPEILPEY